jgi:hypothetical protein
MDQFNLFFKPIDLMLSRLMHLYANFEMCHLATLEISAQTFSSVP